MVNALLPVLSHASPAIPASLFSSFIFRHSFTMRNIDLTTSTLRPRIRLQLAAVLVILAVWHFNSLSPLAYGSPWTKSLCMKSQWLRTWDFSCNDFYDDYISYSNNRLTATHRVISSPAATTVGGDNGGRPAIAVPDQHYGQQVKALGANDSSSEHLSNSHSTIVFEGKAEPGVDVFAQDHIAAAAMSNLDGVHIAAQNALLEISSEATGSSLVTEKDITGSIGDSGVMEKEGTHVESDSPFVAAGPLEEAELEASKAAKELFASTT